MMLPGGLSDTVGHSPYPHGPRLSSKETTDQGNCESLSASGPSPAIHNLTEIIDAYPTVSPHSTRVTTHASHDGARSDRASMDESTIELDRTSSFRRVRFIYHQPPLPHPFAEIAPEDPSVPAYPAAHRFWADPTILYSQESYNSGSTSGMKPLQTATASGHSSESSFPGGLEDRLSTSTYTPSPTIGSSPCERSESSKYSENYRLPFTSASNWSPSSVAPTRRKRRASHGMSENTRPDLPLGRADFGLGNGHQAAMSRKKYKHSRREALNSLPTSRCSSPANPSSSRFAASVHYLSPRALTPIPVEKIPVRQCEASQGFPVAENMQGEHNLQFEGHAVAECTQGFTLPPPFAAPCSTRDPYVSSCTHDEDLISDGAASPVSYAAESIMSGSSGSHEFLVRTLQIFPALDILQPQYTPPPLQSGDAATQDLCGHVSLTSDHRHTQECMLVAEHATTLTASSPPCAFSGAPEAPPLFMPVPGVHCALEAQGVIPSIAPDLIATFPALSLNGQPLLQPALVHRPISLPSVMPSAAPPDSKPWLALFDHLKRSDTLAAQAPSVSAEQATSPADPVSDDERQIVQAARTTDTRARKGPQHCPICGRVFRFPNGLALHLKWHWGASGLDWKQGVTTRGLANARARAERTKAEMLATNPSHSAADGCPTASVSSTVAGPNSPTSLQTSDAACSEDMAPSDLSGSTQNVVPSSSSITLNESSFLGSSFPVAVDPTSELGLSLPDLTFGDSSLGLPDTDFSWLTDSASAAPDIFSEMLGMGNLFPWIPGDEGQSHYQNSNLRVDLLTANDPTNAWLAVSERDEPTLGLIDSDDVSLESWLRAFGGHLTDDDSQGSSGQSCSSSLPSPPGQPTSPEDIQSLSPLLDLTVLQLLSET